MKIFLRDRLKSLTPDNRPTSEASKWEKNLNTSGITFYPEIGVHRDHVFLPPAIADRDSVVFLHTDTQRDNWEKCYADNAPNSHHGHLVIISTLGGQALKPSTFDRVHVCHWSAEQFGREPHPRARSFADSLVSGRPNWQLIRPAPTERLWALRLLCEGFLNPDTKLSLPPDWLQLLGPQGESPDATIAAIATDATDLSKDGAAPGKIRAFLTDIKNAGASNQTDPKVVECLSVLNSLLGISPQVSLSK